MPGVFGVIVKRGVGVLDGVGVGLGVAVSVFNTTIFVKGVDVAFTSTLVDVGAVGPVMQLVKNKMTRTGVSGAIGNFGRLVILDTSSLTNKCTQLAVLLSRQLAIFVC